MNGNDDRKPKPADSTASGHGTASDRLAPVEPGWDVYGSDDSKVGRVHDVGADFLEVEKGVFFIHDIYIPGSAVAEVDADAHRVVLNVAGADVGEMGWTQPPIHAPGETRETWGQGSLDPAEGNPRSDDYAPRHGESRDAGRVLAATGGADRFEAAPAEVNASRQSVETEPVWKTADPGAVTDADADVADAGHAADDEPLAGAVEHFDGVAAAGYTAGTGIPPVAPRSVDAESDVGDADATRQPQAGGEPGADGMTPPRGW